jgi:periplasmic protein TonB
MPTSLNLTGPRPAPNPSGSLVPVRQGPKLLSEDERWGGSFFSLLKDYLTERPVRLPAGRGRLPFTPEAPKTDFAESLKIALGAEPRLAESSPLLIPWKSGWGVFVQNLREFISPPKLPPLKLTCAPAPPPKEIWTKDENVSRAQWLSVLVHAVIAVGLTVPLTYWATTGTEAKTSVATVIPTDLSDYVYKLPPGKDRASGGGGGGERNPVPASKGRAPKFSLKPQLAPPVVIIQNPNPKLPVEPTLYGPPEIKVPQPNLPNYGDPLAAMVTNSSGPGSGSGIGTGSGGGVGSGSGPGLGPGDGGGTGGGHYHPGAGGIGYPECVYCPNPPYTEEARKARFQGTVLLEITILPDGRTAEVRVLRGVGMGLDESALQTVRTWRFKPMIGPGNRPVPVDTPVEVTFRLF